MQMTEKSSIAERVYADLLRSIVSGTLPSGTKVHLDALAYELDVSRTPLREAFLWLKQINLAQVTPYRSTLIAAWGPSDMAERAHTVGWIAGHAALSEGRGPQCGALRAPSPEPTDGTEDDIDDFALLCDALIRAHLPQTGSSIIRVHAEPLFAYLRSPGPDRHGIDLAATSAERRIALERIRGDSAAGDFTSAAASITAYTDILAHTLAPAGAMPDARVRTRYSAGASPAGR